MKLVVNGYLYEALNPEFQPVLDNFIKEIQSRFDVDLSLWADGDFIVLNRILVPKGSRKQGIGSKVMTELTSLADKNGKTIMLILANKGDFESTTSRGRLVRFYRQFGFYENKGRKRDYSHSYSMIRPPKESPITESSESKGLADYIKQLYSNKVVEIAQKIYDDWVSAVNVGEADDEYFGGGICHLIADEVSKLLNSDPKLDAKTISYDDEVHVAALARWASDESSESFPFVTVDIPWRLYETGGGYSFEPIEGVKFTATDVVVNEDQTSAENWDSI